MTNLLGQAINCDDGDAAAKLMQDALGVENNNVVNYCFSKIWPTDREQRAHIIGWLQNGGASSGLNFRKRRGPQLSFADARRNGAWGRPMAPAGRQISADLAGEF